MPLNVRRFCTSVILTIGAAALPAAAQTPEQQQSQTPPPAAAQIIAAKPPTSAEVMRERISKAKAFIAVRNYNAAIYELENIRRETADPSVLSVSNVLLMNSFLEQGNYKRAQDFLTETYNAQKANKPDAAVNFTIVAGQVIKSARSQVERYRSLGLTVSDRTLPLEAVNDIERMREMLELVVKNSKEMGKDAKASSGAFALLEEATNARAMLARDDYDARRWKDEIADSREMLANTRSVITNAVDLPSSAPPAATLAASAEDLQPVKTAAVPDRIESTVSVQPESKPAVQEQPKSQPEPQRSRVAEKTSEEAAAHTDKRPAVQQAPAPIEAPNDASPLQLGSLLEYATEKRAPIYPPLARNMRTTGVVKVEVVVDEQGDVSEVQNTSGPALLQSAARDAVKKWKFKPFVRDGQPVKAIGYVNFNFSL